MADQGTTEVFQGDLEGMFEEETAAPEEVTEEEQPEEAPPAEEPAPEAEPEGAAEPEAEAAPEAPPVEEQPLLGGKFKTPEAAVQAYEAAERLAHERAREAAEFKRKYAQLEEGLQKVEPLLRQAMEQQQVPEEIDLSDQEQVRAFIHREAERIAQEQVAPVLQAQEQENLNRRLSEIQQFRSAHPDALQHETALVSVVEEYRYDESGEEIFPPTKDNLEIALTLATRPEVKSLVDQTDYVPDAEMIQFAIEAADSPPLMEVVEANPQFLNSDKGMNFARKLAGMPQVITAAKENAAQAQTDQDRAQRNAAHVEKGEAQAPVGAAPQAPQDALEEALIEAEQSEKSVFG